MLLHEYYDFGFVRSQSVHIISRLLIKAAEKREEQNAWEIWIAKYPHMTKVNFVDFKTFLEKSKKPDVQPENTNETVMDTFNRFKGIAKGAEKND